MHGIGQRLDRRHDDRIAGVDAERIDILHGAHGDARVVRIAHDLVFDLLPTDEASLDHDLADRTRPQTRTDAFAVGGLRLDDAAAGPAEREGRADDGGQADRRQGLVRRGVTGGLGRPFDDEAGCVRLIDPVEQVAERLAVLGHPDRLQGRAEEPDRMAFEDARVGHGDGEIERGLAAEAGEQAVRALLRDHRFDRFDREWLEVDDVRHGWVGHDRGRVGVDEDRPDPLGTKGAAGLGAGVVELRGLPDDDGAGAEDQHRGRLAGRADDGRRARDGHRAAARATRDGWSRAGERSLRTDAGTDLLTS